MKKIYLPSQKDWEFWRKLEKKFGVFSSSSKGVSIIKPEIIRLLVILARQIYFKRPYTLEEFQKIIEKDSLLNFSYYEAYLFNKTSKATEHLPRLIMKEIDQFNETFGKTYPLDYLQANNFPKETLQNKAKKISGKKTLYALNAHGIIQYELALTLPLLAISLTPGGTQFSANDHFLNLGITLREQRIQWNFEFLRQNIEMMNDYKVKRIGEVKNLFVDEKEYERFWKMTSVSTLLLREYGSLKELQTHLLAQRKQLNPTNLKVDENFMGVQFNRKVEGNLEKSFDLKIDYIDHLLNNHILSIWESLGGSKNDIERHLPPANYCQLV